MNNQQKRTQSIVFNFKHTDHHPRAIQERLCAARLEGFNHGYKAAVRLNMCVPEPWSDENRARNELYIKGAIEAQSCLHEFLGKSGPSSSVDIDDPNWEDIAILGQYAVGYMHGYDSGCIATYCDADPDDETSGSTPTFGYLD